MRQKPKIKKVLTVNIEYRTDEEIEKCFNHILSSIKERNFDRKDIFNCLLEWSVKHAEFKEYRVEIINEMKCMVIQSKMNVT